MANPSRGRGVGFSDARPPRSLGIVGSTPTATWSSAASNHVSGGYSNRGESTHGRERGTANGHGVAGTSHDHGQREVWGASAHNQDQETADASTHNIHSLVRGRGGLSHSTRGMRGRGFAPGFERGGRGRGGYRGRGRGGPHVVAA